MKHVLIVHGSPRKQGNTAKLAAQFARGAEDAGHNVTQITLKDKTIHDCLGCGACQYKEGQYVQQDDMQGIYQAMQQADVIVLASPVYFYTWTSLMKRMLDRTFAVEPVLQNKTFYLLSTGAAPEEQYMKTMIDSFQQYVSCFAAGGNKSGGYLFGYGTNAPDDIQTMPVMDEAYALGKAL